MKHVLGFFPKSCFMTIYEFYNLVNNIFRKILNLKS